MTTYFFGDTAVLTGRTLRHVTRSMDTIITTVITPVAMMLMFVYVFGGAIDTGSVSYVNYMLPGILLITIASGISYTAYRLFTDMKSGIFERFQSMPIARSGVLWAHVFTSLVANLISLVIVVGVARCGGVCRRGRRAGPACRARRAGSADRPHLPTAAGARRVPRTGTTAHPRQDRAPTPGPVVTFPSSARRAGPAASGACSRRAGHSPSYWITWVCARCGGRGPSLFERSRELGGARMASRGRRECDGRA
ncbi:ABC transporter permease [Streptomyces mirabilis]